VTDVPQRVLVGRPEPQLWEESHPLFAMEIYMFSENELQHIKQINDEENSILRSISLQLVLAGYWDLEGEALREKFIKDLLEDDTLYTSH